MLFIKYRFILHAWVHFAYFMYHLSLLVVVQCSMFVSLQSFHYLFLSSIHSATSLTLICKSRNNNKRYFLVKSFKWTFWWALYKTWKFMIHYILCLVWRFGIKFSFISYLIVLKYKLGSLEGATCNFLSFHVYFSMTLIPFDNNNSILK